MYFNGTTLKGLAFAFLCFYAVCYPIGALLLLNQDSEGVGSLALQAFQGATVIALLFFWKVRRLSRIFNFWFWASVYFVIVALYMSLFRAFDERTVEITYALRFILWFIFALALEIDFFSPKQIKTIVRCFWLGAIVQCCVAIVCYAFGLGGGSIYSDINASAGSKYVSGKMVVSFVLLEIILSLYWFIRSQKRRVPFLLALLLSFSVILFSFNRAGQLGLAVAVLWGISWLIRKNRVKLLSGVFFAIVVAVAFLASTKGDIFLDRWRQIERDEGSGRVEILNTAVNNIWDPKSPEALFIGRGYHKTKNLMNNVFGIRIGTHSDLLDFATSYGLVGLAFYIGIISRFFSFSGRIADNSLERFCCRATTVAFVVMSLVTGVFQGTYAVLMFLFISYYYRNQVREIPALEGVPRLDSVSELPLEEELFDSYDPQFDEELTQESLEYDDDENDEIEPAEIEFDTDDSSRGYETEIADDSSLSCEIEPAEVETKNDDASDSNRGDETEVANVESEGEDAENPSRLNKNEIVDKFAEKNDANDPEIDGATLSWLNEIDSLFGDLGEINKMFPQNVGQTETQERPAR